MPPRGVFDSVLLPGAPANPPFGGVPCAILDAGTLDLLTRHLRAELEVGRVSVAVLDADRRTFRIVAWDGKGIFASGTELPLATSTQVGSAASGRAFACAAFADEAGWDRPTDRLMDALGFRSGCALPVHDPTGAVRAVVSLSSTAAGVDYGRRLDVVAGVEDVVRAALEPCAPPELTRREEEVLRLLELGLRFKQVALELGISEATAKGYARDLFRKLAVTSRAEAVFEARRHGLLH